MQVSTIDIGNPATNVIPATATAVFNIRFNDRWTSETLKHWLAERLDAVGGNYTLDVRSAASRSWSRPGRSASGSPPRSAGSPGRTPELSTTGGTSDARFIHSHCPVAEFGLVGQTMHKVDERVESPTSTALTEIYGTFLGLFFDVTPDGRHAMHAAG